MKISKILTSIVFIFTAFHMVAQKKIEVRPYTIATTYEKLKKDHPFITPIEALQSQNIIAKENEVYKSIDGRALKADVYYPEAPGKSFPAVLLIHGGGWASGSKENLRIMSQHLAENGFVAVTASYRLSGEATYPAAVLDLKEALLWMKKNAQKYKIDKEKIAVLGTSAGAQLATLLGVTSGEDLYKVEGDTSDEVQAIINIDGIVSFIHPEAEESGMAGQWLGGLRNENPKNWKEASPLEYVDENTPPTLFINSAQPRFHAGRDDMMKILEEHKIYSEVHTIKDTPHSFWHMHPWFQPTIDYTVDFLEKVFSENQDRQNKIYKKLTIAQDGSGDFKSIQAAVNSVRDLGPGVVLFNIKNGTYKEKLVIPSWKHKLTFVGEDKEKTIITFDDYSGKINPVTKEPFSTFTSSTVLVQGDDITFDNLTIENTWCGKGQAVALHVEGDRFVIRNSKILGCQDTIYAARESSRQLYSNCYIEGTTDFIFGQATAVFTGCTIKSLANSYITAAATTPNQDHGFVFFNCELIAAPEVDKVYLGRPWRPYAQTVFISTKMGPHIVPEGWNPWKGDEMFPEKEKTTYYAEYRSTGKGAAPEERISWSHQLSPEEAESYTVNNILGGKDNWQPLQRTEKE